ALELGEAALEWFRTAVELGTRLVEARIRVRIRRVPGRRRLLVAREQTLQLGAGALLLRNPARGLIDRRRVDGSDHHGNARTDQRLRRRRVVERDAVGAGLALELLEAAFRRRGSSVELPPRPVDARLVVRVRGLSRLLGVLLALEQRRRQCGYAFVLAAEALALACPAD